MMDHIENGIYRFDIESIVNEMVYGQYINKSGKRVWLNFTFEHMEEGLKKDAEKDLKGLFESGKTSFNLIVNHRDQEYKLIEVPLPGVKIILGHRS